MEELKNEGVVFDEIGPEYIIQTYDPKLKFHGILVIDNTNLGLGKGGIRMTPTVSVNEVCRLARAMTYKNALAGLPFGGAKAGIIADPKTFGAAHKRAIMESFANSLRPLIPSKYIAGPDINTTELEMEQFARAHGEWESATGKPATFCTTKGNPSTGSGRAGARKRCGLPHELGSTGYGVSLATKIALQFAEINLEGAAISIAGYGNVGVFAHKFLQELGATIVAVSDSSGTIYDRRGLDFKILSELKAKTGSVAGYPGAKRLTRDVIYELTADVLIPAAGPDVINEGNIGKVKARIIVEGANIPMAEELEIKLHRKDILVLPDFLANAGGVISSYAEYKGLNEKQMFKLVTEKITPNVTEVLETVKKGSLTPRAAALKIARSRVLNGKK